jgi:hypothetical protein
MGERNEGNGIIVNLHIVEWNHNTGLVRSSTGDGRGIHEQLGYDLFDLPE